MDDQWHNEVNKRIADMELQHTGLRKAIDDNTAMTVDIKRNTDDIVEFFLAAQGTFKALKAIGTMAKWVTTVSAALALFWLALKGWNKP